MIKLKLGHIILLGVIAVMFLTAMGCGSSGDSSAGQNINPTGNQKGVKKGGKHDASVFVATS